MTLFRSEGANYDETAGEGTLPSDVRRGYQGLFSSPGVLPSSSSPLVEGAGDFTYTVHTGYWVTSRGGSDGYHYWGNVGDLSVATSVAPAAGLSRIDIIYALHPSAGENGDTTSQPVVAVAQGTEASSPVAPSLPVGALELARNTMTSAATSTASGGNTITQTAPAVGLIGPGFYRVRKSRTTVTPIDDSTWTRMSGWNQLVERTGGPTSDISTGSSDTMTVNFDGWARVTASMGFATAATGNRNVRITRNGTVVATGGYGGGTTSGSYQPVTAEYDGPVTSGDVFAVDVYQSSGGTLNTHVTNGNAVFFVERTA